MKDRDGEGWFLLWADRQNRGRGRKDRRWESPPGGLYFTLRIPLTSLDVSPILCSMGSMIVWIQVLDDQSEPPSKLSLKWPNDLLLNGRKVGGVLGEVQREHLYLGMGLNVNNSLNADGTTFRHPATSLLDATESTFSRRKLLFAWFERFMDVLLSDTDRFFDASRIESYVDTIGRRIRVREHAVEAVGLHEDGGLIVESEGDRNVVYANEALEIPYP